MKIKIYLISGNKGEALAAVRKRIGENVCDDVEVLGKEELIRNGGKNLLRKNSGEEEEWLFIYCHDLDVQGRLFWVYLAALITRARTKLILDHKGKEIKPTMTKLFCFELPKVILGIFYTCVIILSIPCIYMPFLFLVQLFNRKVKKYSISKGKMVAYLRTDFWFDLIAGGSVTHTLGVCQGFKQCGYEVLFLSTGRLPDGDAKLKEVCIIRPKINRYSAMEVNQIYYNFTLCRDALRVLKQRKPTFLYQRCSALNCSGVILSILLGVPLILEFNSSVFWSKLSGSKTRYKLAKLLFEKINLAGSAKIIVVSNALKERLVKFGIEEGNILVNFNGVDPERFAPKVEKNRTIAKKDSEIFVGFVGIFEYWHGVITLSKAVRYVAAKNEKVRFLMVGDGKLRREMEEIVKKDGMEGRVIFTGVVPHTEVPSYLNICDILVSPHQNMFDGSTFFGSPTKLFEYMAMEKAVIASEVGQMGEILKDGVNALLVPPGEEEKLAEAILKLANDQCLREELGKKARVGVIEKYTWGKNAEKVIGVYHQITA